jgi:uncharacterized protein YaeQ
MRGRQELRQRVAESPSEWRAVRAASYHMPAHREQAPAARAGNECPMRSHHPSFMALTATLYNFAIQLSDVDRGVYEPITLKVAQHPSETDESLIARVLAYCLEFTEGIAFSRGLAEPDEPAIAVRDLTGALKVWIDIGVPDAGRLHKASKAAPRVAVYTHKGAAALVRALAGERIHRAEALELFAFDRDMLNELVARLDRRMVFDLSVTDQHLFITLNGETISGILERVSISGTRD